MKAARFYNKGDIRIEDIPEPTVAPGTVGINVAWCGICGTDLHEFMEGPIFIPPCGHPHPISGESAPVTMGHEFSGVVYAVGEGVDDIKVGQHVVVEPYIIRDDVPTGEGSNYHLSKDMNFIGLGGCGGGLSEKIAVKRRWVHPISDKIPLDQAALIEPLSVGHHAYVRSGAKEGDVALVGGAGPIGLLLAAVLKAKGIKVIITELSKARKDKAREAGVADYILDPSEVDVVEEVKKTDQRRRRRCRIRMHQRQQSAGHHGRSLPSDCESRHRIHLEPPCHHQRPQRRDERAGRARHHRLLQRPRRNHQIG